MLLIVAIVAFAALAFLTVPRITSKTETQQVQVITNATSISYTQATQTMSEQVTVVTGYFLMLNTNQGNCFWDTRLGWMCGGYYGSAANLAIQGNAACGHSAWLTYVKIIPPDMVTNFTASHEAGGTSIYYLHHLDGHTDTYRGGCGSRSGKSVITFQTSFMGLQSIPISYTSSQISLGTITRNSTTIMPLYSNLGLSDTAFGGLAILVIGFLALVALVNRRNLL